MARPGALSGLPSAVCGQVSVTGSEHLCSATVIDGARRNIRAEMNSSSPIQDIRCDSIASFLTFSLLPFIRFRLGGHIIYANLR